MVRKIIFFFILFSYVESGATVNNVSTIIGIELSSTILSNIVSRDRSSIDGVVLGSIKAQMLGNLTDAAYYFDSNLLHTVVGVNSLSEITTQLEQNFSANINECAATNRILQSYTVIESNNFWIAECKISSRNFKGCETNELSYVIYSTNSEYKVCNVLIDKCSIMED